ncbi:hypothetical protein BH11PLA2_BH11PLA2_13660 [soil metagenome]
MTAYSDPVNRLLTLGTIKFGTEWMDYPLHGFTAAEIPELIRLSQDQELAQGNPESPQVFAQVHAWRALGQIRAESAIGPLLDLLVEPDENDDWDDWLTEEIPVVMAMIGPTAIPAVSERLQQCDFQTWATSSLARALTEIAKCYSETRDVVVSEISQRLERAAKQDPAVNGMLIAYLLDLNAKESWPVIEAAFATGNVDEFVAGGPDDVKYELQLGPKPPPGKNRYGFALPGASRITPKAKALDRKKKRKAKKVQKAQRRRK